MKKKVKEDPRSKMAKLVNIIVPIPTGENATKREVSRALKKQKALLDLVKEVAREEIEYMSEIPDSLSSSLEDFISNWVDSNMKDEVIEFLRSANITIDIDY